MRENKLSTMKKRIIKKKSVIEDDTPLKAIANVEDVNLEMEVDEDVALGFSKIFSKALSKSQITPKNIKGKGLLIKKKNIIVGSKHK